MKISEGQFTAGMSRLGARQSELRFRFRWDFHVKQPSGYVERPLGEASYRYGSASPVFMLIYEPKAHGALHKTVTRIDIIPKTIPIDAIFLFI